MDEALKHHFKSFFALSHANHRKFQEALGENADFSSAIYTSTLSSTSMCLKLEIHKQAAKLKRKIIVELAGI